jgi:hypothetical protein
MVLLGSVQTVFSGDVVLLGSVETVFSGDVVPFGMEGAKTSELGNFLRKGVRRMHGGVSKRMVRNGSAWQLVKKGWYGWGEEASTSVELFRPPCHFELRPSCESLIYPIPIYHPLQFKPPFTH